MNATQYVFPNFIPPSADPEFFVGQDVIPPKVIRFNQQVSKLANYDPYEVFEDPVGPDQIVQLIEEHTANFITETQATTIVQNYVDTQGYDVAIQDLGTAYTDLSQTVFDNTAPVTTLQIQMGTAQSDIIGLSNSVSSLGAGVSALSMSKYLYGLQLLRQFTGHVYSGTFRICPLFQGLSGITNYASNLNNFQNFIDGGQFDNSTNQPPMPRTCIDHTMSGTQISNFCEKYILQNVTTAERLRFYFGTLIQQLNNTHVFDALGRLSEYQSGTLTASNAFKYKIKGQMNGFISITNVSASAVLGLSFSTSSVAIPLTSFMNNDINHASYTQHYKTGTTNAAASVIQAQFETEWSDLNVDGYLSFCHRPGGATSTYANLSNITFEVHVKPAAFTKIF